MNLIIVGNEKGCTLCKAAYTALDRENINYTKVDAFSDEGRMKLQEKGIRTIPAFFDNDNYLGDYQFFLKEGYTKLRQQ